MAKTRHFAAAWWAGTAAIFVLLPSAVVLGEPPTAAGAGDAAGAAATAAAQVEPLLRGPIHEAFAAPTVVEATPAMIVPKKPPKPIDEIPPDVRPKGDRIQWIPGYWAWDDEDKDFFWMSGVWRDAPPGRRWVPGYWAQTESGWQWNSGLWADAGAAAIGYQPLPPKSLESGPNSNSPGANSIWVPGCWVYRQSQYRWRPGFWTEGHPGWAWTPDHYLWTPGGAVFVGGYWDLPLDNRGLLFAPVAVRGAVYTAAGFRYTPNVVIEPSRILTHLFIRANYHHYYFGDYYGNGYGTLGIYPWLQFRNPHLGFDPLLSYYTWTDARRGVNFVARLLADNQLLLKAPVLRPPRTLGDLNRFLATNQITDDLDRMVLGRPLGDVLASPAAANRLVRLTADQRKSLIGEIDATRRLSVARLDLEHGLIHPVGSEVARPVASVLHLPVLERPLGAASPIIRGQAPDEQPGSPAPGGLVPGVLQQAPPVPLLPNSGGILGSPNGGGRILGGGGILGGGDDDDDD